MALLDRDLPAIAIIGFGVSGLPGRRSGALQGRRVLLTCSEALQERAALAVRDVGGVPVRFPLIRLVPADEAEGVLGALADFDVVAVTSPSAVRFLVRAMHEQNIDVRRLPRVAVCGSGTAAELRQHLIEPDIMPGGGFSGEGLVEAMHAAGLAGARVLRLRSDIAGPDLADALRARGMTVEDCVLYRNEAIGYDTLPPWDIVFFASSSAVDMFMSTQAVDALQGKTVLAIGQPTASALAERGRVADLVSPEATVEAAMRHLACQCVAQELGNEA